MADFKKAYQRTAVFEGGYTDNPDDNGNWTGGKKGVGVLVGTNYGITAPELMRNLGRVPTKQDMKNISKDLVESIYKKNYWDPISGDKISNQDQANAIYDMAINAGVGTAIILAKRVLGIAENTQMDKNTINKLNNQV